MFPGSDSITTSASSFDEILLTQLALLVNNSQLIDNTHWETFILTILPILLIPGIPPKPPPPPPPPSPATSTWTGAPVSWLLLSTGRDEYSFGLNLQLGIQTPPVPSIFQFCVCHSYIHYITYIKHTNRTYLELQYLSYQSTFISVFTKSLRVNLF